MRGFSLVELSIVLVILGLLTGGILAGQSLIRAAELRAVSTELHSHQSAIMAFRDKYMALPGDMHNAIDFWGEALHCPGDHTTPSTTPATCNGNGNGKVDGTNPSSERHRLWQHLTNAGLMPGQYAGVIGPNGVTSHLAGFNSPASKMPKASWMSTYTGLQLSASTLYEGDYGHTIMLVPGTGIAKDYDNLKPEEAWNLDVKLDDGKPAYGKVRPYRGPANVGCTTSDTASIAAYALTTTDTVCSFIYNNAF